MMNIGEKLKQARLADNLTQEEVAGKVGVSRQTMSNWENGKSYPDIASLIILSDVYGMTLDSLLKEDNEMIKHLKESTDVTKSNKQLVASIITFMAIISAYFSIRHFVPISEATNTVFNIIIMISFVAVLAIAFVRETSLKKVVEQKTSNKTLLKLGFITLYALIYLPLVLLTPEAINTEFQIGVWEIQGVIRVMSAFIWLIPALVIYKKFKYLFAV